jgi:hypothetical protein
MRGLRSAAVTVAISVAFTVADALLFGAPAAAQTARDSLQACRKPGRSLVGNVWRIDGRPVSAARVTLAWAAILVVPGRIGHVPCLLGTETDPLGRFQFDEVAPSGPLVVRADGAQGEIGVAYRQEAEADGGDTLQLWMPTVGPAGAGAASVAKIAECRTVGRVVFDDGAPVARAAVRVAPLPAVRTTERGDFTIAACPSREVVRLEVNGLPIAPFAANVLVPESSPAIVITVDRRLPRLDPVLVEADRRLRDWQGFDDRRERADGTFMTREQIRRRDVPTLTRLFETVPGVRIGDDAQLYIARNAFDRCPAAVYLDGQRIDAMRLDAVTVPDVLGIEVYRGASDTPAQFTRLGTAGCGTVVIWSRIAADPVRSRR